MTINEIQRRELEIAVEMAQLAEADVAWQKHGLELQLQQKALEREQAELALAMAEWAPVIARRERDTIKATHGNRYNGSDSDDS